MEIINPTPVKIPPDLKKCAKEFADKKELGNLSRVIIKALIKYINYKP